MVRRHGWQLPAHTFQVVAITVFCLLVVAFYAFFAPFLGGQIWEYALFGTYSLVALLVFILYVRSTAINPADPGIMSKFDFGNKPNSKLELSTNSRKFNELGTATHSSPSSARSSMTGVNSVRKGSEEQTRIDTQMEPPSGRSSCHIVGGILCAAFVHEDCRKQDEAADQQGTGEDALYCTLCEAEVRKFSKHCRSCDKCVDGFDHHCRWLNNCVGRKNYLTFISLMATSLVWLVIEAGVGIAVLVRCFVHKKNMEADIVDRLGHGFSLAPFATVVAVCTAVSMLACVPLGELFFFHMILIRKVISLHLVTEKWWTWIELCITTYEYVVAMRAMSEAPAGGSVDEELGNVLYSPTGSATTGFSGGSSLGLQYKGAWCTPPRVFVDYQEEVVPHLDPGMVPSTVDPDAAGNKLPKRPVRISAWKLAKLDSNEAVRAAAKARASSSVLRPVDNQRMQDPELSSSGNLSVRSSVSTDMGGNKDAKNEFKLSPLRNSFVRVKRSGWFKPSFVQDRPTQSSREAFPSIISNPISHISAGFDEKIVQRRSSAGDPLLHSGPATSLLRDIKRTSVVWDQEAGRYVSVPVSASEARGRPSWQTIASNPNIEISSSDRRPVVLPREPSSSVAKAPLEQSEKLMYTGESIFFGGPLLSVPVRDRLGNEKSGLRLGQDRVVLNLPRESTSNPLRSSGVFELNPPAGSSGLKNK
ncbi:putative protein S-acyltransferase 19 [Camellia lanceoleosa]|nr:putative protein S-acyltransferase 19 [Camellia lanceoleosa]